MHNILANSKNLIIVFISIAVLSVTSAYFELQQSKDELFNLMENQAHSLLESILISSQEVYYASSEIENEMNARLLNNANIIRILLEQDRITNLVLKKIAEDNNLFKINIINKNGKQIYSSASNMKFAPVPELQAQQYLSPIFNGEKDTLLIGLRKSSMGVGFRYVVALASSNNDAIVLNLDAEKLLEFRRRVGLGILIRRLAENKNIIFSALEDENGVIAASPNVDTLKKFSKFDDLRPLSSDNAFAWEVAPFNGKVLFQAAHIFELEGKVKGLIRIGLSLEPLNLIYDRITRKSILIAIILFVLASVIFTLVFVKQDLESVQKQYKKIESFSNEIIQSVSDAIVVIDKDGKVIEINQSAEKLFGLSAGEGKEIELNQIIENQDCLSIMKNNSSIQQYECEINSEKRFLLISKSDFIDENDNQNRVLVIKDLTEIKQLEKQVNRNRQLKAMGELASGVAHEIRNPLNAIGTIVQQLDKDFEPVEDGEEFHSLAGLVYSEVKRINETIQNFLRFSRPEPIQKQFFNLNDLISNIEQQYSILLKERMIDLEIEQNWNGDVYWDRNQIKQVLINLMQNSIDAIKSNGKINLKISNDDRTVTIILSDTGPGISESNLERIFDLYFTTKAEGTGIGLSIIQRIIAEHDGMITVESKVGEGTTFVIKLPQK
ncbi:MAG: PAS domain S-box protein [Chlorobi bacterium]|nr:PAS domain S-box protein [Chlorobiota bacterium]